MQPIHFRETTLGPPKTQVQHKLKVWLLRSPAGRTMLWVGRASSRAGRRKANTGGGARGRSPHPDARRSSVIPAGRRKFGGGWGSFGGKTRKSGVFRVGLGLKYPERRARRAGYKVRLREKEVKIGTPTGIFGKKAVFWRFQAVSDRFEAVGRRLKAVRNRLETVENRL